MTHPLSGRTALVVDDEFLIGAMIEEILASQGATVFLATHEAEAASLLAEHRIDFALIDYKLHDASTDGLSVRLADRGVPFAFCTGSMAEEMQKRFPGIMVIPKPFGADAIVDVARALVAGA
jgi:DNA-binding response OmpR family regulator